MAGFASFTNRNHRNTQFASNEWKMKGKWMAIHKRKGWIIAAILAAPLLIGSAGCGDFWQAPNGSTGTTADTVTLAGSVATVTAGGTITFTATVSPTAATGTVTFYSGNTSLGNATLSTGVATLSPTFATAGTFSITAKYLGDGTYEASTSSAVSITVTAALTATTTQLTASTPTAADSVTFTATVAPAAATGAVNFDNGATQLGSGTLASGTATATVTLAAGTYSVTANYVGDNTYAASTSSAVPLTITAAASSVKYTTISLNAAETSLRPGGSTTLTAVVSDSEATGNVTFYDAAVTPALLLGIAPLDGGTATIPATFKTAGTHEIMASYSGTSGYAASVTQGALPIMIDK